MVPSLYRLYARPRSADAKPGMAICSRPWRGGNSGGPVMDDGLATLYRDVFLAKRD